MKEYKDRTYRNWMKADDLIYFQVKYKESDLYIGAYKDLSELALKSLKKHRKTIDKYIDKNPEFKSSLKSLPISSSMPKIIKEMIKSSLKTGIGPMSCVAGTISEYVGRDLSIYSDEILVENGGDIYITGKKDRKIAVFAGESTLSGKIAINIRSCSLPLSVATSSATVGPSLSFGKADAVLVTSPSGSLADSAATATGNIVKNPGDFNKAINFVENIPHLSGLLIICKEQLCIWGDIKISPLRAK